MRISTKLFLVLLIVGTPILVGILPATFQKEQATVLPADTTSPHVGIVDPLLFTEFGTSSNTSVNLAISNTTPGSAYLEVPAQWQTTFLNLSVSNLYENRTWTNNTGFNTNTLSWNAYDNASTLPLGDAEERWVNQSWLAGQNSTRLKINGTFQVPNEWHYSSTLEAGFKQRITIPRGDIISAKLFCDIFPQNACAQPVFEIIFYIFQNNQPKRTYLAYEDFTEIALYKNQWYNRSYSLDPALFNIENNNTLIFGYGIVIGRDSPGTDYGFAGLPDAQEQILFFDNVRLHLQTQAKPSDVNLTILTDGQISNVIDNGWSIGNTVWYTSFPGTKNINPTMQVFQFQTNWTDCKLDWSIVTNASTTSDVVWEPAGSLEGLRFTARQNQPIAWDFYIYARIPVRWTISYHIHMNLTNDWAITRVLDPYFVERTSEIQGGSAGSGSLEIPQSIAGIFGFWKVEAQSPNYNLTTRGILDNNFQPGKHYQVNSIANFSLNVTQTAGLPENLATSISNITVHHPNSSVFFDSNTTPGIDGIIQFPLLEIGAQTTSLGTYMVDFLWTNGTAVAFWTSNIIVQHQVEIRVLIPSNYASGQNIQALFGSSLALRVEVRDVDANYLVSDIQVSLSIAGESSSHTFNEVSGGTYDLTLDSNILPQAGIYTCTISSTGTGVISQDYTIVVDFFVPQTMTWVLIGMIAALAASITAILVRTKVVIPRRKRAYDELMELTSHYYDAHALVGYIVLYKRDGVAIFDQWQDLSEKRVDANLISGFLTAITAFGEQLPVTKGFDDLRSKKKQATTNGGKFRIMFFDYQDFVILLLDGRFIRVATIFATKPSVHFETRLRQFAEEFEDMYEMFLTSFAGSIDAFQKADGLFNKYLHFHITRPIGLAQSTKAKKAQKNVELTDEEHRMMNVIQTFLREKDYVRLRTVASLYATATKEQEMTAVKGIVGLWLKGMLAPVDPEESIETALHFFSQEDAEILGVIAKGTLNHDLIATEVKLSRNAVDAKLQSFRAWKLINMRDQITEKGRVLLERRLAKKD